MVQDAVAAMSELELLFKYLDAMGTLKVRSTYPKKIVCLSGWLRAIDPVHLGRLPLDTISEVFMSCFFVLVPSEP